MAPSSIADLAAELDVWFRAAEAYISGPARDADPDKLAIDAAACADRFVMEWRKRWARKDNAEDFNYEEWIKDVKT